MIPAIEFQVVQKSTTCCETVFQAIHQGRHHDMRLWIICGGEPCLAFEDFSFSKRYRMLPRYAGDKFECFLWDRDRLIKEDRQHDRYHYTYAGCKYQHQEFVKVVGNRELCVKQGPTIDDIGGKRALTRYLDKHAPRRDLALRRWGAIQELFGSMGDTIRIESKPFRDPENRCAFRARLELRKYYLSPVTAESKMYVGRCDDTLAKYADPRWKTLQSFFTRAFDRGKSWDTLTERQFEEAVGLLKTTQ